MAKLAGENLLSEVSGSQSPPPSDAWAVVEQGHPSCATNAVEWPEVVGHQPLASAIKLSGSGHTRANGVTEVVTLGLIWLCHVTAARMQDRDGARLLLERIFQRGLGRLRLIWVDVAYRATTLFAWIKTHLLCPALRLEVAARNANTKGFVVQPRR